MTDSSRNQVADPTASLSDETRALYELQKPFAEPMLRMFRLTNTVLDIIFYDVGVLIQALWGKGTAIDTDGAAGSASSGHPLQTRVAGVSGRCRVFVLPQFERAGRPPAIRRAWTATIWPVSSLARWSTREFARASAIQTMSVKRRWSTANDLLRESASSRHSRRKIIIIVHNPG
jgi:hypothetical protein